MNCLEEATARKRKRGSKCATQESPANTKGKIYKDKCKTSSTVSQDTKSSKTLDPGSNKRKGFQTLLERVHRGDIQEVAITHKDRLCRYGFELVEFIFQKTGTKILVSAILQILFPISVSLSLSPSSLALLKQTFSLVPLLLLNRFSVKMNKIETPIENSQKTCSQSATSLLPRIMECVQRGRKETEEKENKKKKKNPSKKQKVSKKYPNGKPEAGKARKIRLFPNFQQNDIAHVKIEKTEEHNIYYCLLNAFKLLW